MFIVGHKKDKYFKSVSVSAKETGESPGTFHEAISWVIR